MLFQAGLPPRYWCLAARAFCLGRNAVLPARHGSTPWAAKNGTAFPGKLLPFGCKVNYRPSERTGPKFAPRSEYALFVGWHLQPGGIFKGDYLVVPYEALVRTDPQRKLVVRRVKEVDMSVGPLIYPLRQVRDDQVDNDLLKAAEGLDETEPVVEGDEELPTEAVEDELPEGNVTPTGEEQPEAVEDEERPVGDGTLVRIPRGSRIFIPRVGAPPPPERPFTSSGSSAPPKKNELRDEMLIEFAQESPKRPESAIYGKYEKYKVAKTVGEARSLGATRPMILYDMSHGLAKITDVPAVVVLAMTATHMPLLEAWCASDSELGVVGQRRGRQVIRYTRDDDLSKPATITRALKDVRTRRGTHLHGSIPCTPWTSWQRINLHKARPETRERILKERAESLKYVATFQRIAKAALNRGGSVSFEWPRHCEGWKESAVQTMLTDLCLVPVDVDGCRVGVTTKSGEPILKPWRIAVSSPHLEQALQGLRCEGGHKHAPCAGA